MCMPGMSAMELEPEPDDALPESSPAVRAEMAAATAIAIGEDAEEDAAVLAGVSPHER